MRRKLNCNGVILIILFCWATGAWAQERKFDLTVFTGLRTGGSFEDEQTGSTLKIDEAAAYGLSLDVDVDANGQMQVIWSRQESKFETAEPLSGSFKLSIDYYHFGGTYSWTGDDKFKPYVAFSLGATHFQPSFDGYDDALRFSAGLGLGLKYFITPHIGLMAEGRGFGTFMGGSGAIFCGNGSCRIAVHEELFIQVEGRAGMVLRF